MKEHEFGDGYMTSPVMGSFKSTPDHQRSSSVSEPPVTPLHSPSFSDGSPSATAKGDSGMVGEKKSGRKGTNFVFRVREHVKMGPKFSETVKGKLSLGARIIRKGGRGNIFKQIFGVIDGEKLLKASQCYLSTTAGPIAGILFISTVKVAFCSERSITFTSPTGEPIRKPYKVLIPTKKIKRANESENVDNPSERYIEVVTVDDCEFWFMGFVRFEKALVNLQKAISLSM